MLYCISGKPHCGKSTFMNNLIKELNINVSIITDEIIDPNSKENNPRIGFQTIIREPGQKDLLYKIASIKPFGEDVNYILLADKWYVNLDKLDEMAYKINELYEKYNVMIIDEIASMQLLSDYFAFSIIKILCCHQKDNKKIIFTASKEINPLVYKGYRIFIHDALVDFTRHNNTYYYLPYDKEINNKEVFNTEYPKILNKFINDFNNN